ncbi:MAG: hypothetical protein FJ009_08855 [Chloroflexi bacterium]|nr:hypothetical protein [Chloroflexota bacterium]
MAATTLARYAANFNPGRNARALRVGLQFRVQCQHLVHRRQWTRVNAVPHVRHVITQLQAHQLQANELA